MHTVTVTVDINPDGREEFIQAVRSVTETLKNEKGFRKSGIFQDVDNPNRFSLMVEWESREDLDNFLKSDMFRVLMGALKVLGEHSEVRYDLAPVKSGKKILNI